MRLLITSALIAIGLLAVPAGAGTPAWYAGQVFPSRPVKLVVPFPISGPTDIRGTARMTRTYKLIAQHAPPPISDTLARMIARALGAASRHGMVLERQPGAATTRGALAVARAAADGHTLLLASNATMVLYPHYFYDVGYDPVRDFVLVAPLATMPFVLLAGAAVPADGVQDLAAWLKVRPGEINYGSSGDGSTGHLAGELFRRMTGVSVVHVPYNGGMAALDGLAKGQVSLMFAALPLALPYLGNEHFRPLGVASRKRVELLPELPALAESGLPDFEVEAWYGVFAGRRTPPAARVWLGEQIAEYMAADAARAHLLGQGLLPVTRSHSQFATRINAEHDKWAPVLRAARLPFKDDES